MSSVAEVYFVFEIFRLVPVGKQTCFAWQNWNSSVGKVECFWCGEDEILYVARIIIDLIYIFANSALLMHWFSLVGLVSSLINLIFTAYIMICNFILFVTHNIVFVEKSGSHLWTSSRNKD